MSNQPEALRLADQLERMSLSTRWDKAAAIELRRLHAANIDCVAHFDAVKAERDEKQAELDATNRQVEILSNGLAESRRINAVLLEALKNVMYWDNGKSEWEMARAAIARAIGEQA